MAKEKINNDFKIVDGVLIKCLNKKIVTAKIPNGVKAITDCAFKGLKHLESVYIPDSVTNIEMFAFYECIKLKKVRLPKNIDLINEQSFAGCSSLEKIDIPDKVHTIGFGAFIGCKSLKKVKMSLKRQYLLTIGANAFFGCESLTKIVFPALSNICEDAFFGCKRLKTIYLSELPEYSDISPLFEGTSIKEIYLHNTKENWEEYYKNHLEHLEENDDCSIKNIKMHFLEYDPDLFLIENGVLKKYLSEWELEEVIIPSCVKVIDDFAFDDEFGFASSIKKIRIPDSVEEIKVDAFISCYELEEINIPSSVTKIVNNPFWNSYAIKTINVDKNNSVYDSRNNCNGIIETATNTLITGIPNTIIPNTVSAISKHAFDIEILDSIFVPRSVNKIDKYAFISDGKSFDEYEELYLEVFYEGTEEEWEKIGLDPEHAYIDVKFNAVITDVKK